MAIALLEIPVSGCTTCICLRNLVDTLMYEEYFSLQALQHFLLSSPPLPTTLEPSVGLAGALEVVEVAGLAKGGSGFGSHWNVCEQEW